MRNETQFVVDRAVGHENSRKEMLFEVYPFQFRLDVLVQRFLSRRKVLYGVFAGEFVGYGSVFVFVGETFFLLNQIKFPPEFRN